MTRPRQRQQATSQPALRMPTSLIKRVNLLTKAQNTFDCILEFQQELNAESNHRGAAILIASTIENVLETALLRIITKGRAKNVFGYNEPLGGFSNKITMGYALDLFGDEMFRNLQIIRHIRNTFAHSKIPLRFDRPEIAALCNELEPPEVIPPMTDGSNAPMDPDLAGLPRYRFVADRITHNLLWRNINGSKKLQHEAYPFWVDARTHEIVVKALPLP